MRRDFFFVHIKRHMTGLLMASIPRKLENLRPRRKQTANLLDIIRPNLRIEGGSHPPLPPSLTLFETDSSAPISCLGECG